MDIIGKTLVYLKIVKVMKHFGQKPTLQTYLDTMKKLDGPEMKNWTFKDTLKVRI